MNNSLPPRPAEETQNVAASASSPQPQARSSSVELELACVDLVCKLEHDLANAKEGYRGDHVDESAVTSRRMLTYLVEFTQAHLPQREGEIIPVVTTAVDAAKAHEKSIKSRSWTMNLMSVFVNVVEDVAAQTHAQLGEAMSKACHIVLSSAVENLGPESQVGQQVQQSLEVFAAEFTQEW